jgi:thiol-disulfide isomerase/thioredoxin
MSTIRLLLIIALALLTTTSALQAEDYMPWANDLATAQQIAASKNKLILVHFTADWCGPCQRLKKRVYCQRSFGHSVAMDYVPVKIDVGTHPEIAKHFNVTAWPTDLLLAPSGQELHRMVCPQAETEYLSVLRQVAWRRKVNPTSFVGARLASHGNTPPSSSITAPVANMLKKRFGSSAASPPSSTIAANGNVYNQVTSDAQRALRDLSTKTAFQPSNQTRAAGQTLRQFIPDSTTAPKGPIQQAQFVQVQSPQSPTMAGSDMPAPGSAPVPSDGQTPWPQTSNRPAIESPTPSYTMNPMAQFAHPAAANANMIVQPPISTPTPSGAASVATPRAAVSPEIVPENIYNEFVDRKATAPSQPPPTPASQPTDPAVRNDAAAVNGAAVRIRVPVSRPRSSNMDVAQQAPNSAPVRATAAVDSHSIRSFSPDPTAEPKNDSTNLQIAMDGYCPVTLYDGNQWVAGDQRWGARHRGSVYLFRDAAAQQKFLSDPDRYSPVLAGFDPVAFVDEHQYVTGSRRHGIRFQNRIVLFSSESGLRKFATQPDRYLATVQQAMRSTTTYR